MLIDAAHLPTVTQNDIIVTNVRHYEALNKALEAIHRVQSGLRFVQTFRRFSFIKTYESASSLFRTLLVRLRMIWYFRISFNIFVSGIGGNYQRLAYIINDY